MILELSALLLFSIVEIIQSFFFYRRFKAIPLSLFLTVNSIFFLIPTLLWFVNKTLLTYSLEGRVASAISGENEIFSLTYVLLVNGVIIATSLYLLVFRQSNRDKLLVFKSYNQQYRILPVLRLVIIILMIFTLSQHGFDFISTFSMSYRDQRAFNSNFIQKLFFAFSYIYIGISYVNKGLRFQAREYIFIIVISLFALGTGQRRELFSILIYLSVLSLMASNFKTAKNIKDSIMVRFSLIGFAMIILWYLRSSISSGLDISAMVDIRSPFQVLFGSISTGFPSLNLVFDYQSVYGQNIFLPFHIFVNFIPRALWPNKPIVLSDQIQDKLGLIANPSVFVYGDMFAWLGFASIAIFPLLIYVIYRISRLWLAGKVYPLLVSAYATSCSFMLFKNGIVGSGFHFLLFCILLKLVLIINRQLLPVGNYYASK